MKTIESTRVWQRLERRLWTSGFPGWLIRMCFDLLWINIRLVPEEERLWRAVNKREQVYAGGQRLGGLKPSFFRDRNGLSLDLARFSTVERSRLGHGERPYPVESGLAEVRVGEVRAVGTDIEHLPVKSPRRNYSHVQFTSALDVSRADGLARTAKMIVPPSFRS